MNMIHIKHKDSPAPASPLQPISLTKPQFYRLLESPRGSYDVCKEVFKDSKILTSEEKTVEVAKGARMFAENRKSESRTQKFLIASYLIPAGTAIALGLTIHPAFYGLLFLHSTFYAGILYLYAKMKPYSAKVFAPIFHAKDKILLETQRYLENREFDEYQKALSKQPAEKLVVLPFDDTRITDAKVRAEQRNRS